MQVTREDRIRARRRIVFATGLTTMLLTGAAALAFGAGCIFDDGGYDGGGRRTGAPTATDTTQPSPGSGSTATSTNTSTSTSTSTPDSGGPIQDAGMNDA
jgi:hypothetical protein